jgi:adenylate kinase family enzyme
MLYIFEGARNSGKTYLSKFLSERNSIPRFQFDFVGGVNLLQIPTSAGKEMHAFATGKELMLLQLHKDLPFIDKNFIHDRGILSVLVWGIVEKRISTSQALSQLDYVIQNKLLQNSAIVYIEGENPDQSERNKDQWDFADAGSEEKQAYEFLLPELQKRGFNRVIRFKNDFTSYSCDAFANLIQKVKL